MVDPASRHSLGEYYTPDWIADIALKAINYKEGKILDPACGSGTFLLAAIRYFRNEGLKNHKLVETALSSILGIDVHPLAVMMAKANILLGLASELRNIKKEFYLPVYMADTLLVTEDKKARSISINVSEDIAFHLPFETLTRKVNVDEIIDRLALLSEMAAGGAKKAESAWKAFSLKSMIGASEHETFLWKQNLKLFIRLIKENRNSIWAFILKNAYRPAFIRRDKVDYVVGNPPWLAYRYIKDKDYKSKVKTMTVNYGLLEGKDVKLFTHLDTSTLFFVYSESHFLKDNGTIAFVLPKTTIQPAKQHLNFQNRGFTELHDFTNVSPLFNVRSVLAIKNKNHFTTKNIPMFVYEGRLPVKNMDLSSAKKHLTIEKESKSFVSRAIQSKYYYGRFLQGATIVPRCFWFVQQDKNAAEHNAVPFVETSEEAYEESKKPWDIKLQGRIEKQLLYETVLAKGLVSFGIIRTETIFLPVIKSKNSFSIADANALLEAGLENSVKWLQETEKIWEKHRQSEDRNLIQWLNYNQKLTKQVLDAPFVVLYNSSGTNLAAALYLRDSDRKRRFDIAGFCADAVTYYFYPNTVQEGYYLLACLNSDIVNDMIKQFQPEGLWGARHIQRRPFEACPIVQFDPNNSIHNDLAQFGKSCTEIVDGYLKHLKGNIGRTRGEVRRILQHELQGINKLVKRLFEESGQTFEAEAVVSKSKLKRDLFEKSQ